MAAHLWWVECFLRLMEKSVCTDKNRRNDDLFDALPYILAGRGLEFKMEGLI